VTWGPLLVFMGTHGWLAPAMFFRLKYKVNAHAKANTDQNCSFDAVIITLFGSVLFAQPLRKIGHKLDGSFARTLTDAVSRDQLSVRVNRHKRPLIAQASTVIGRL
jgi:hypothetical protein